VADVKRCIKTTSPGDSTAALGAVLGTALAALARAGSVSAAKTEYVAAVGALQEWVALAGLSNKIKGI
jgi:hypothetical protein